MFKYLLLAFLLVFTVNSAKSQLQGQAKIDSLLKELPKLKQDTNAVIFLVDLSYYYYTINPDEGIKYGEQGLEIAKKLNWLEGQANSYNSLGANYLSSSNFPKVLECFNESLKIFEKLGNKRKVAAINGNIGNVYLNQSDYPKALEYFQKALKVNEEINDKKGIAISLGNIGNAHLYQSNFSESLKYFFDALKIYEELGDESFIASLLANIGSIYMNQADYPKSLEYFQKALKINEEFGNKLGIAKNLGNIGSVYSSQKDYPKALEYYLKALEIEEELGNKSGIAFKLGNIGNIFINQSDYPKALEYYQKALKISKELGSKSSIAYNLGNIGWLYLAQSQDSIINISENKIELMLNKEINLKKSIEYSKQAVEIFKEIGALYEQFHFLSNLSEAYQLKGDYKNAYETFKEHKTLQDSIFSMDKQKELANLDAKRENELKDAEITILQTEKKAQQFQSYLLGGGIIVLFGAFGVAFLRFREKKKLSDKLSIQNAEIENQKSIVEEKNEQIVSSITYASTIQHAILPWNSTLKEAFSDILIFYKPKDIVSGDSYWFQEVDGIKFLAAIDCTGHGIPGAMLTVIASTALDDAVLGKRLSDTGQILTYMNEKVTEVLNQRLAENSIRDGMEIALISISKDKIQFSGAGRPLYMKNGNIEIIKTDKRGIAGQTDNDEYQFSAIEIEKSENMTLYLTTDGFADQMNESSKKYSTKRFVALLDSISEKPISEQHEILENEFNSHKGTRSQIDDITILGVRI